MIFKNSTIKLYITTTSVLAQLPLEFVVRLDTSFHASMPFLLDFKPFSEACFNRIVNSNPSEFIACF